MPPLPAQSYLDGISAPKSNRVVRLQGQYAYLIQPSPQHSEGASKRVSWVFLWLWVKTIVGRLSIRLGSS